MIAALFPACRWRLPVVLASALLSPFVAAQQPASAPAASAPSRPDPRPRIAVVGFETDSGGDSRDAWLPLAVEETLTWRLRRVPALIVIPTVRCYQGRQEFQAAAAPALPWPRVLRGLGVEYQLTGKTRGSANELTLDLVLQRLAEPGTTVDRFTTTPGRLFEALDQATRWLLTHLDLPPVDDAVAARVYAPPSSSVTTLEYYAQSVQAARADDFRTALRFAEDAVQSDKRYRPALGLLAQLELRGGRNGREAAALHLRVISDLARLDGDVLDRGNAELAQSLLLQSQGSYEAAFTRAETALELAYKLGDVYGQVAALGWISDLYLTWRPPASAELTSEDRTRLEQENLRQAADWQGRLLDMLTSLGDVIGALPATSKVALIHERLGDYPAALEGHQKTLRLAQSLGSRPHEATAWLYIGQWYRNRERWDEALDAMKKCLDLADETSKPAVRIALGSVYQAMKAPDKVLAEYEQAYELLRRTNDLPMQLTCLREIARARQQLGHRKEAISALQDAIDIAHALELPDEESLRAELAAWKENKP